jgi:hypothetical protein
MYAFSATMDWLETFPVLPFEQPPIWLLLRPAPALYARAEGEGYKQLYLVILLAGLFPPFWLFTWWLAIFPARLEREAAKLKRAEK